MIIIDDIAQGTPEWHLMHGSVPSASCFDKIITTTGKVSAQRKDYMCQLAGVRVFEVYEDTFKSTHMQTGIEREQAAKDLYQVITGSPLHDVGFCYFDERRDRGCSPDALIGNGGVLEVKSPMLKTHVKYLLAGKLPTAYFCQVQGGLYITGHKWAHFMSFFPDAEPLILKVERDQQFIDKLDKAITDFNIELAMMVRKLKEAL